MSEKWRVAITMLFAVLAAAVGGGARGKGDEGDGGGPGR